MAPPRVTFAQLQLLKAQGSVRLFSHSKDLMEAELLGARLEAYTADYRVYVMEVGEAREVGEEGKAWEVGRTTGLNLCIALKILNISMKKSVKFAR